MTPDQAKQLGAQAFADGRGRAPALNHAFMVEVLKLDHKGKIATMDAYLHGWDRANLDAPVPDLD